MRSTPGVRSDLFPRPLDRALLTDFFGGVSQAEVMTEEAAVSYMKSDTPTEELPRSSVGERKSNVVKPSLVKADSCRESLPKGGTIPSATVRAWAGAGLIGLFVVWIVACTGRSS